MGMTVSAISSHVICSVQQEVDADVNLVLSLNQLFHAQPLGNDVEAKAQKDDGK
jgi:hypothetical protein